MRNVLGSVAAALLLLSMSGAPLMAQTATVFTVRNFAIPASPPGNFVPNANGRTVPANHDSWELTIDTTGLPNDQLLADVVVQYHYTGVQLGATGQPNQGQLTNTDGSITQIDGGIFTGWINDCEAPLRTTYTDRQGNVLHSAFLGCDLHRILGAYPDTVRFLIISSPGYGSVPSATFDLN